MELKNIANDQLDFARNATDIAGLDSLRQAAHSGNGEALEKAAQEFEAIFVRMMLKSMRQAQEALADENNPMNSQHVKFYRDMHDQQIASDLAAGEGMGLAKLIVQQLGPQQEGYMPSSAIRQGANLPTQQHTSTVQRGQKAAGFDNQQAFVDQLLPAVKPVADALGIDASGLVAQAALETGWGQHMIHSAQGKNSHNLFGIKASNGWQGEQATVPTLEYKNGVANKESAAFRVYSSIQESIQDYKDFLQHGRYSKVLEQAGNTEGFFSALQKAGYATDPQYADKVMGIMKRLKSEFGAGL
ncbi:flagellar assembly peptidoglycan hydrolase FlgJ [Alteromonas sediminis]|uniref:Peptidoglycan hydrolase FlgJ n=1 Tax=Alteromonas sediminis TaxID=2259342 RepID=A0A3N5XW10_9ALTE|nr:flagellar assembly peptidoglycan hydrolase FlgJ [Alteromonas sediminis]RPJ64957.1 flagellar assembly peptidoglycan hydrolase FlgJ [Alteromonas sediminis]